MKEKDSPYYAMECREEDGKLFIYDADDDLVAQIEIPRDWTIEACLEKSTGRSASMPFYVLRCALKENRRSAVRWTASSILGSDSVPS
jgi:hypothetical protein